MGEGVDMMAGCPAEHPNQRALAKLCYLPHARDEPVAELGCGDGPDAPQPFDRERVQELQLGVGRHDQQAVLARNLVLATPTVTGRPTFSRTSRRNCAAISVGVPEISRSPPTSRNASSIDSPSTKGVVSLNTSNNALLAWL